MRSLPFMVWGCTYASEKLDMPPLEQSQTSSSRLCFSTSQDCHANICTDSPHTISQIEVGCKAHHAGLQSVHSLILICTVTHFSDVDKLCSFHQQCLCHQMRQSQQNRNGCCEWSTSNKSAVVSLCFFSATLNRAITCCMELWRFYWARFAIMESVFKPNWNL